MGQTNFLVGQSFELADSMSQFQYTKWLVCSREVVWLILTNNHLYRTIEMERWQDLVGSNSQDPLKLNVPTQYFPKLHL